jgi:creatinine amidohydrolase
MCSADSEPIVLLPVGATEQHGPHLPTGTDTILAKALSDAVSARTGAVILPPLPIGCSYFHGTELAGTLALSSLQLISAVEAALTWASNSGFRRFLIGNYSGP